MLFFMTPHFTNNSANTFWVFCLIKFLKKDTSLNINHLM